MQTATDCSFCSLDFSAIDDDPTCALYICSHAECHSAFHGSCFANAACFHNGCHNATTGNEQTAAFEQGLCSVHTSDINVGMSHFEYGTSKVKYVHATFQNAVGPKVPKGSAGAAPVLGSGTAPLLPNALADGRACLLTGRTSPKITTDEVCTEY